MSNFEIIINCITALGALATAGTFIYVIRSQKGTQNRLTVYPKWQLHLRANMKWHVFRPGTPYIPKSKLH